MKDTVEALEYMPCNVMKKQTELSTASYVVDRLFEMQKGKENQ